MKNALAKVAILAISPKTSRSPCKFLIGSHRWDGLNGKEINRNDIPDKRRRE